MNRWLIRIFIAGVAIVSAYVDSARGGVIVRTVQEVRPFSSPDSMLSGFTAYEWYVATDDGTLISKIDATFAFPMHQRWSDVDLDGLPNSTPYGPSFDESGDSHLTINYSRTSGSALLENNNVVPSPLPDGAYDYGIGNYLSGVWDIPHFRGRQELVAYTVVPDGLSPLDFNYRIEVSTTGGGTFELSQGIIPLPPLPQPPPPPPATPTKLVAKALKVAPPFLGPESALEGFVAYQLDVRALNEHRITAVDISIEGPLHQRWVDKDFDAIIDPSPRGNVADRRADSHLTPPPEAITLDSTFVEDNNIALSPLADRENFDYGVGSFLRGIWGIPGYANSNVAHLAYIVIPDDFDPRLLDIEIAVVTASYDSIIYTQTLTTADFFPVPEPTTLALCSLGLLVLTTRRTRILTFIPLSKRNPS